MQKKVLIIEDDEAISEALTVLIEGEGHRVITPKNEYLAKTRSDHPDLIFLDILLGGEDGRVLCRKIKKDAQTKDIPVVIMSAHQNIAQETKAAGADDYIAKPFDISRVYTMLTKYNVVSN